MKKIFTIIIFIFYSSPLFSYSLKDNFLYCEEKPYDKFISVLWFDKSNSLDEFNEVTLYLLTNDKIKIDDEDWKLDSPIIKKKFNYLITPEVIFFYEHEEKIAAIRDPFDYELLIYRYDLKMYDKSEIGQCYPIEIQFSSLDDILIFLTKKSYEKEGLSFPEDWEPIF